MNAHIRKLIVCFVLSWVLVAGLYLARYDSMTTDEGIHVASAYLALKRGEFRFDPEHPYLYKFTTALPLLALKLNNPPRDAELWQTGYPTVYDSWEAAREWTDEWFYLSGNNASLMIFLARIPGVLCLVGLCLLVYYLGKKWWSPTVGLLALIFTAFNPTLLGHGHLANNDIAAALTFLLTIWAMVEYGKHPILKQAAWLGLALAVAILTKFSMIILVPAVFLWLVYVAFREKSGKLFAKHLLTIMAICWVMIWLQYFGPYTLINGTAFEIRGSHVPSQTDSIPQAMLERVLLLRYFIPIDYLKGVLLVVGGSIFGRPTYILEHIYPAGTRVLQYFPLLYILKTQLVGLLLVAIGLVSLTRSYLFAPKKWTLTGMAIFGSGGIFLLTSLINKINIGVRHIAPLMVLASFAMALALVLVYKRYPKKWTVGAVLILYIAPVLFWFPNYINFSNVLVYPRAKAYNYYNDSNIDWGQQAKLIVRTAQNRFPGETLYIDYRWNPYALSYFGLQTAKLDYHHIPKDALLVLTATQLSFPEYAQFKDMTPVYTISNHTLFYRTAP